MATQRTSDREEAFGNTCMIAKLGEVDEAQTALTEAQQTHRKGETEEEREMRLADLFVTHYDSLPDALLHAEELSRVSGAGDDGGNSRRGNQTRKEQATEIRLFERFEAALRKLETIKISNREVEAMVDVKGMQEEEQKRERDAWKKLVEACTNLAEEVRDNPHLSKPHKHPCRGMEGGGRSGWKLPMPKSRGRRKKQVSFEWESGASSRRVALGRNNKDR